MTWGPDRLRIGKWRGRQDVAVLTPWPGVPAPPASVLRASRELERRGVRQVLTPALRPAEQEPFLELGFEVRERLHLLRHPLDRIPEAPDVSIRRGWRFDHRAALEVDRLAFSDFWRFDDAALVEARVATPTTRFRVVGRRRLTGFAVTGMAGPLAYLQRLAVHPDRHRRGIGTALVVDSLRWAARHHCDAVLVNTQEHNDVALALYQHLGFRPEAQGLAVLGRRLDATGTFA